MSEGKHLLSCLAETGGGGNEEWCHQCLSELREAHESAEADAKRLADGLDTFVHLAEQGIRRRGVGIGAVVIRKWEADEALYFARDALGQHREQGAGD